MCLILNDRALSLIDDGYLLVTITSTRTTWFAKLRHRKNQNVVTITGNIEDMTFTQKRNGVVVIDNQKL